MLAWLGGPGNDVVPLSSNRVNWSNTADSRNRLRHEPRLVNERLQSLLRAGPIRRIRQELPTNGTLRIRLVVRA